MFSFYNLPRCLIAPMLSGLDSFVFLRRKWRMAMSTSFALLASSLSVTTLAQANVTLYSHVEYKDIVEMISEAVCDPNVSVVIAQSRRTGEMWPTPKDVPKGLDFGQTGMVLGFVEFWVRSVIRGDVESDKLVFIDVGSESIGEREWGYAPKTFGNGSVFLLFARPVVAPSVALSPRQPAISFKASVPLGLLMKKVKDSRMTGKVVDWWGLIEEAGLGKTLTKKTWLVLSPRNALFRVDIPRLEKEKIMDGGLNAEQFSRTLRRSTEVDRMFDVPVLPNEGLSDIESLLSMDVGKIGNILNSGGVINEKALLTLLEDLTALESRVKTKLGRDIIQELLRASKARLRQDAEGGG